MQNAKWIWAHTENRPDEYVRFHKTFHSDGGQVYLEISCDSTYELYVNGEMAAFDQYSDYPYQKVYDRIDITRFCHVGDNTVSILVWHFGVGSFCHYTGTPGLIFEITESGNVTAFSDGATLCTIPRDYVPGRQKIITGQLGFSYTYDMRGCDGCYAADFVPAGWKAAVEVEKITETFTERPIDKIRVKPYADAVLIDPERRIYDLGAETVGYLTFRVKAPAGASFLIAYGEHLVPTEDGGEEVPRIIARRDFSMEFIGSGDWFDFSNYLRRMGVRYLQILGDCDVEVERIGIMPVVYPVRKRPFVTDSTLRRRIYDVSVHTLLSCMFEHYEDCPWREQSLYTMDSRNQMLAGYYAFGEYRFPRASLALFGEDRREDHLLNICVPCKENLVIPSFSLYWMTEMREYAEFSGDNSLIEQYAGKMEEILAAFLDREEDGLVPNFYGDKTYWNFYEWIPELEGAGRPQQKSFDLVLNALVSMTMQNMAAMLLRIGREADANAYLARANAYNEAINRAFYNAETGLYRTAVGNEVYVELGQAYAILCGAAAGDVAASLCEEILHGSRLKGTTLSMKAWKYDALLKVDREKYGKYVLADIDRNFGYMLNNGATSFWETMKGWHDFGDAGSLCHGWSAIPIIYYRRLLGGEK